MAVEIDAHARPIQSRSHLLDMRGLAGAVIAGDDDAAVAGKAGEDGKRGGLVEPVVGIEFGNVLVRLGIGRHLQVAVDAEQLPDRDLHVRQAGFCVCCESHKLLRPLGRELAGPRRESAITGGRISRYI